MIIESLSHLEFFKVGEIMVSNYGHFDEYSGAFPDKVTLDIYVTDEVIVQRDVPDTKILF